MDPGSVEEGSLVPQEGHDGRELRAANHLRQLGQTNDWRAITLRLPPYCIAPMLLGADESNDASVVGLAQANHGHAHHYEPGAEKRVGRQALDAAQHDRGENQREQRVSVGDGRDDDHLTLLQGLELKDHA
jgi:hypothetical protein